MDLAALHHQQLVIASSIHQQGLQRMAPNPGGGGGGRGRGGGVFQGGARKEQVVGVARERQGNEEIRKFLSFYKRKKLPVC